MIKFNAAGSDFKDDSLNLMPYFSTSCYEGYGDDSKVHVGDCISVCVKLFITSLQGFYFIYAGVFRRIADEEEQYMEDSDERLPDFGTSRCDYEEV